MTLKGLEAKFLTGILKEWKIKNIVSIKARIDERDQLYFDCKHLGGYIFSSKKPIIQEDNGLHLEVGGKLRCDVDTPYGKYIINIDRVA